MVYRILIITTLFIFVGSSQESFAQNTPVDTTVSYKIFVVVKNDGTEYVGQILKQDSREVLIKTKELGEIYIPKHEIKEIREIKSIKEYETGVARKDNRLASRYFLTTNGLPIKKGDDYFRVTYGLMEAQFSISDHFSLGAMTSPVGIPIIAAPKFAYSVTDNFHLGAGALVGSLSWAMPDAGGFLAYGVGTFGDYEKNISISVGYAGVWGSGIGFEGTQSPIVGIGSHIRIGSSAYFNFESILFQVNDNLAGAVIPGVRWITQKENIWDFGFTGVFFPVSNGNGGYTTEIIPVPLPMISWTTFFKK